MKRLPIALLLLVAGCATADDDFDNEVIAPARGGTVSAQAVRGLSVRGPIAVPGVDQVLVPVDLYLNREEAERTLRTNRTRASFAPEASRVGPGFFAPATNVVVFDPAAGTGDLLLAGPGLVTRLAHDGDAEGERPGWPAGLVLVGVVRGDADGDALLTTTDDEVAHVLSLPDRTLRPLTPPGESWVSFEQVGDVVYLTTARRDGDEFQMRLHALSLADLSVTPVVGDATAAEVLDRAGVRP